MKAASVLARASSTSRIKDGGHIMKKVFTSLSRLALLLGACAVTLPTSPAYSEGKANGKAKGKQKVEAEEKGKHGRRANSPTAWNSTRRKKASFHQDCKKRRMKTVN